MTTLPAALDAHAPPLDLLASLVEAVDAGHGRADDQPADDQPPVDRPTHDKPADVRPAVDKASDETYLIRVVRASDGVELGLLPLDGHPFEHLVGLEAPDDWWAVGVVAHGTARPMTDDGLAPRRATPGRRVRTTHLVARTGDAASVLRLGDDDPRTQRHPDGGDPRSLGAIDDGLRRVLGLPSAPAPPTTIELWAICWLDEVRGLLRRGLLDGEHWPSVAACHPLFTLVPELGEHADATAQAPVRRWAIEHLDRAGRHFAHRVTWRQLLADERQRDRPVHLDRDSLRWMDEGLFAREVIAAMEHSADVLDEIGPGLSRPVRRRIQTTLGRWQLPSHGS